MSKHTSRIIVIDLDDTICFPNHSYSDSYQKYGLAEPNLPVIESMKVAKSQGFVIEIFTARRMLTHKSNVQSIEEDVGDITRQWLDKYEVPYDRLMFGKPYAQYYVDDKAMRPDEFVSMINE